MPQVSKNKLEKDLKEELQSCFYKSFLNLETEKEAREFLDDLITPTEKIMLAKRMGITKLLKEEFRYRKISGVLKVSYATVGKIKEKLRSNMTKTFNNKLKKKYWKRFVKISKALLPYSKGQKDSAVSN